MTITEYEALPTKSDGLTEVGQRFVSESLLGTNLNMASKQPHESHAAGDEVSVLEISRVHEGVIINFDVIRATLTS